MRSKRRELLLVVSTYYPNISAAFKLVARAPRRLNLHIEPINWLDQSARAVDSDEGEQGDDDAEIWPYEQAIISGIWPPPSAQSGRQKHKLDLGRLPQYILRLLPPPPKKRKNGGWERQMGIAPGDLRVFVTLRFDDPPPNRRSDEMPVFGSSASVASDRGGCGGGGAAVRSSPSRKGSRSNRASSAVSSSSSSSSSSSPSSKRTKLGLLALQCGCNDDGDNEHADCPVVPITAAAGGADSSASSPSAPMPTRMKCMPADAKRILGQQTLRAPEICLAIPVEVSAYNRPSGNHAH